jgi:hypothetical protein
MMIKTAVFVDVTVCGQEQTFRRKVLPPSLGFLADYKSQKSRKGAERMGLPNVSEHTPDHTG